MRPHPALLRQTGSGVTLAVRVTPRARKSGLAGIREDALLVRLTAPPVEGAANEELVRVIAALFDVPPRAVTILSGERGRLKTVHISGVSAETAAARLAT